ncbi:chymotrypsin-1-like [Temnothorax americanus]|uniref:chymotrypsin-1-like n=1 Tax=Temnothorax americanus TaxID=1964332 RepID=UPI004067B9AC
MSLRCVLIFLCIVINITVCQYSEYAETRNVTCDNFNAINHGNNRHSKVLGENYANLGQFPYVAVIHRLVSKTAPENERNKGRCGGTIISARWVLTAAHCLQLLEYPQRFLVVFGIVDKSTIDYDVLRGSPGVSMITTKAFVHWEFDRMKKHNDIGLLLMPEDIPFSNTIMSIKLSNDYQSYPYAHVAGWGANRNGTRSMRLRYNILHVIQNNECSRYWMGVTEIIDKQICTAPGTGRDPCKGYSGGPLIAVHNHEPIQIGIVSYGDGFCPSYRSIVYTKVSLFINWINDITVTGIIK